MKCHVSAKDMNTLPTYQQQYSARQQWGQYSSPHLRWQTWTLPTHVHAPKRVPASSVRQPIWGLYRWKCDECLPHSIWGGGGVGQAYSLVV